MLSYAEFYKPKFFLLENVLGLLNHKLHINKPGPQEGEIVANGIIKFILRALTSLGYVGESPLRAGPLTLWLVTRYALMSCRLGRTGRRRIVAA